MAKKLDQNSAPELWGGIECTINRVNNQYFDQLEYANHYKRENDLQLIADLGIKTLRYPILWERHQPNLNQEIDWTWTENQLGILIKNNIKPIAGLLHHGSGPQFTNLLSDNFASAFASYAEKVACKFPWIDHYTPINEPLTTARFSGLYGHWYPHLQNDISFAKMLLNQMKAVVLSMQAIRGINPSAKLIQTEDLGKTYSTSLLQYQASFENIRRWLTYDLLCGKVQPGHTMWNHFIRLGIREKSLNFFLENQCPPDVMGFNYYITSERFLDENVNKYPVASRGGNELQSYADVEAVRVPHGQPSGLSFLLEEAWTKYKLPIAITEVHLNCGREDQQRWLKEIWDICNKLKEDGINIKAVTAWSLLGSFGWDKLLTSKYMTYEIGAFDIRPGLPRATELSIMIKELATRQSYTHPILLNNGWWKAKNRFLNFNTGQNFFDYTNNYSQPILIFGKTGTLGQAFGKICSLRAISHKLLSRGDVDVTNEVQIEEAIKKYNPWAVINATGYVKVDVAEKEIEKCYNENLYAPYFMANACKKHDVQFLTFSTDLVFDGNQRTPYFENDKTNPLNVYGWSKVQAESVVIKTYPKSLIIRTSSFFGPWDEFNFISKVINSLTLNRRFHAADDVLISPTYIPDLVNEALDLIIDNESGIWHLSNNGEITWADFAIMASDKAGLNSELIYGKPSS